MNQIDGKVIVTCAITGAIHTPSMSPYLPITPDEIAKQAIDAAKAGAAIIHLHARDPEDGRPTSDPDVFARFLPVIKAETDAIINVTTGAGLGMSLEDRVAAVLKSQPEMCSLNMGSFNFALFHLLEKKREWKYSWEPEALEFTRDFVFRNSFRDLEWIMKRLSDLGTRYEYECYDVGHLYNLAHCLDQGYIQPPLFIQTIFGILGGIGTDRENLVHMRHIADKLFGDQWYWSILAAGKHQFPMTTMGATMGGNVRVGLEDNLYLAKGQLAKSNAELVERIGLILNGMSLELATPDETRQALALKGPDQVAF